MHYLHARQTTFFMRLDFIFFQSFVLSQCIDYPLETLFSLHNPNTSSFNQIIMTGLRGSMGEHFWALDPTRYENSLSSFITRESGAFDASEYDSITIQYTIAKPKFWNDDDYARFDVAIDILEKNSVKIQKTIKIGTVRNFHTPRTITSVLSLSKISPSKRMRLGRLRFYSFYPLFQIQFKMKSVVLNCPVPLVAKTIKERFISLFSSKKSLSNKSSYTG